jgi:uncharacterized membrane protein YesL
MREALSLILRAFKLWWSEFFLLTILNFAWLALQVPIITGPPATAAMYVIARRIADGEEGSAREAARALRQMLLPAWKWGALNLIILAAVVVNFWAYNSAAGLAWDILRLAWGTIATLWFAVNLFYWPFWLAQKDQRVRVTLRNAFVLYIKSPGLGLTVLIVCALLIAVSIGLTLPLAVGLMAWLALIGVLAVDSALKPAENAGDSSFEMELI